MRDDPRINAKSMTIWNYLSIFLVTLFFCGSYAGLYFLQLRVETSVAYVMLSMLTYIVVISLLVCMFFAVLRKKYFMRPIYRLSEAARRVTHGDYETRIEPMRKDGKKDELEVLFDDFNTMVEELASTEIMKKDFVYNVSHEFKTPLAAIQNYAFMLQSGELNETERLECSRRIAEVSQSLAVLITNILQLNKLENQKISPSVKTYNLSEQLSRCILNYDTILDEKAIELDVEMNQNLLVKSDEALMDIVWNNLLSNAVKFTPVGGEIDIHIRREGDMAVVEVTDNGCGMTEKEAERIFEKFYQADASHAGQGNGLGLSLVKRIIEILGAQIQVISTPDIGTTFLVRMRAEQF